MPIKKCTTKEGGSGWKYGDSGHCYKDKKDAVKQMVAIKMSQKRRGESTADFDQEYDTALASITPTNDKNSLFSFKHSDGTRFIFEETAIEYAILKEEEQNDRNKH